MNVWSVSFSGSRFASDSLCPQFQLLLSFRPAKNTSGRSQIPGKNGTAYSIGELTMIPQQLFFIQHFDLPERSMNIKQVFHCAFTGFHVFRCGIDWCGWRRRKKGGFLEPCQAMLKKPARDLARGGGGEHGRRFTQVLLVWKSMDCESRFISKRRRESFLHTRGLAEKCTFGERFSMRVLICQLAWPNGMLVSSALPHGLCFGWGDPHPANCLAPLRVCPKSFLLGPICQMGSARGPWHPHQERVVATGPIGSSPSLLHAVLPPTSSFGVHPIESMW